MRGADGMQEALFTVAKLEDFVPADHPLRPIRALVNEALEGLNSLFNEIYSDKGRPRSNDTHESTTDPDARLYRKSHNAAAILCYQGHALMENRCGLVVSAVTTHAS